MKVYNYKPSTGEYLSKVNAVPNPLEEGEFLIPAGATIISPLEPGENEIAVWNGSEWVLTPDYRDSVYYDKNTGNQVDFGLGDSPGENMTILEKEDSEAVWNETVGAWQIPVEVLIENKRIAINAERTTRIAASTVFFMGHHFDADQVTQNNLSNLLLAISSGIYNESTVIWRTADDQNITLQATELPTLGALMLAETNTLYGISWTLKDQFTEIAEMDYGDAVVALEELVWPS